MTVDNGQFMSAYNGSSCVSLSMRSITRHDIHALHPSSSVRLHVLIAVIHLYFHSPLDVFELPDNFISDSHVPLRCPL